MKLPRVGRVDVLLSLLAATLLQLEVWAFEPGPLPAVRSLLGLTAAAALAYTRPYPIGAFLVNGFSVYGLIAVGAPSDIYQWTNLLALVLMASRTPMRKALALLVLSLLGIAFYFWRFPQEGTVVTMLLVQMLYVASFFGGASQRALLTSERLAGERDLAEARLATRQAEAELASERNRIARELHDVVGHALTAMVVQAGAGESVALKDPASARGALEAIARQGRSALADMDRMLSLLHGETPRSRLPRLEELEELIAGLAGPDISLRIEGDVEKVPPSISLAGYRIVQEALTNALRHSQAGQVDVSVRVGSEVTIRVTDDGIGGNPQPGRGLAGMAERTALHGGKLRFGAHAQRGFEIEARLPLGNPP